MLGCIYKEKPELVGGQPDGLGLVGHPGPTNGSSGGVGQDLSIVDAVVVEPGQRRQLPRHRRGCRRPAGPRLRLGGEVANPEVDVVAFRGERMHTELGAPAGPGLEVAAVGGGGVGRMPDQPAGGQPQERVISY